MQDIIEHEIVMLKKRVEELERRGASSDSEYHDIVHKLTMALGMLTMQHEDIRQIKLDLNDLQTKTDYMQHDIDFIKSHIREMDKKLDLILAFLSPEKKV